MTAAWVHPHSRGENRSNPMEHPPHCGSSPLARGKCGIGHRDLDFVGFIPTRAGKITASSEMVTAWAVHPHSRGENVVGVEGVAAIVGSSPLARGKSCPSNWKAPRSRFIPTRAGKILGKEVMGHPGWVHPHSRGENLSIRPLALDAIGSSPLARGKCCRGCTRAAGTGFIPTRAGKITTGLLSSSRTTVHPHSRGENGQEGSGAVVASGSSPLARGKCGGRRASRLVPRVHPHSRGENLVAVADLHPLTGSSPLARGKCYRG